MSRVFDELDDESAPSTGEEIGAAVSTALEKVAESNATLAEMLSKAITEALDKLGDRPEPVQKKEVKQWRFDVHRDSDGRMTHVVANAT